MYDDMFVLDAHSHSYKPQQSAWGYLEHSYEQHLKSMDKNGIDVSVTMGFFNLTPEEQWEQTIYTAEATHKYPDRFIGIMAASPLWGKRSLIDMKFAAELGIRGLKLNPPIHGGFPIDSDMVDPLVDLAKQFGWVVIIHTDINSPICNPHLAVRLAKRHPEVRFQLSHMGLDPVWVPNFINYIVEYENIYVDTSATPNRAEYVFRKPAALIPDRILFATDGASFHEEVELIKLDIAEKYYDLKQVEKQKIIGLNAARLYNVDVSRYLHS